MLMVSWTLNHLSCLYTKCANFSLADGTDDFLCISPNGDVWVSINQGGYAFKPRFLWKQNEGPKQDRVRIADIDGDGRADYCTIADNGDITCWRNGGQGKICCGGP